MRDYDLDNDGTHFEIWLIERMGWQRQDDVALQTTHGDTLCGKEIKLDKKFRQTKNLFIETKETPRVGGKWHTASIFVSAKMLYQGDYQGVFVVSFESCRWFRSCCKGRVMNDEKRAEGILIPCRSVGQRGQYIQFD